MISLKNGASISNIVVSTILGHSGDGMFPYILNPAYRQLIEDIKKTRTTVITKSSTYEKRIGNYIAWKPWTWKYIKRLPDNGILNAYKLTNDGIGIHAPQIGRVAHKGIKVIPNFYPEFSKGKNICLPAAETVEIMKILWKYLPLSTSIQPLELNFSCPNSPKDRAKNVEEIIHCARGIKNYLPNLPIIAKISCLHSYELAEELEKAGVDAIHAVNSIPFKEVFPYSISPMQDVGGGGVSGSPAFPLAYQYNKELRKKIKIPIIMGCGVTSTENYKKYKDIGADAVSICSLVAINPREVSKLIIKNSE